MAVKNVCFQIVDLVTGLPLGPGQDGELCFKSPCITKGYLNNPEARKLAFDEHNWFHTGNNLN